MMDAESRAVIKKQAQALAKKQVALHAIRQKLYQAYKDGEGGSGDPRMVVEYADIIAIDAALDS